MIKKLIIYFVTFLIVPFGCSKRTNLYDDKKFESIEAICNETLENPLFLDFVDALEKESRNGEKAVYTTDYSHYEHSEIPEGCGIYLTQSLNPSLTAYSELVSCALMDAFNAYSSSSSAVLQFQSITVCTENNHNRIGFRISQREYHINDIHLVKGDPLDALYQTGIFYGNPGIGAHWRMDYIQLAEEWYLVWFNLADET